MRRSAGSARRLLRSGRNDPGDLRGVVGNIVAGMIFGRLVFTGWNYDPQEHPWRQVGMGLSENGLAVRG